MLFSSFKLHLVQHNPVLYAYFIKQLRHYNILPSASTKIKLFTILYGANTVEHDSPHRTPSGKTKYSDILLHRLIDFFGKLRNRIEK